MRLIWEDRRIWPEVSLIIGNPETIHVAQIPSLEMSDVADMGGVFGPYREPLGYSVSLPEIFGGASFDLIDY